MPGVRRQRPHTWHPAKWSCLRMVCGPSTLPSRCATCVSRSVAALLSSPSPSPVGGGVSGGTRALLGHARHRLGGPEIEGWRDRRARPASSPAARPPGASALAARWSSCQGQGWRFTVWALTVRWGSRRPVEPQGRHGAAAQQAVQDGAQLRALRRPLGVRDVRAAAGHKGRAGEVGGKGDEDVVPLEVLQAHLAGARRAGACNCGQAGGQG
jgi:hypothetical protein